MPNVRVKKFLKAYEEIENFISGRNDSGSLNSLSIYVDDDDINFIHQVRILYKKQKNPDSSAPKHYRVLAAKYALLTIGENLTLHNYVKKPLGDKVGIYEIVNNVLKTEEQLKGVVNTDKEADWWIEENKNAIHDTTSNGRHIKNKNLLPSPVVKITSFSGNKVSLAFRKVSKGGNAKYGWYDVKDIYIDMNKFIKKVVSEGFNKTAHSAGILNYTKWEELLEPEKVGKGGKERNPNLSPPRPSWLEQVKPQKRLDHTGYIKPGPKTVDYNGLHNRSNDDIKALQHYKNVVINAAEKETRGEEELLKYVRERYDGEILRNFNNIDIFLPEVKVGFDYHEMLWHLETVVGTKHHWEKANEASRNGIRLIQVYEDEWLNKSEIVRSRISCILGKAKRIFARKTNIVDLNQNESTAFLERTHIQGNYNCTVAYGLENDGRLVACMTFGISRFNKRHDCELLRYSSELNTVVVGGADKLLQNFFKKQNNVNLISYADRRWSNGNLYKKLKFNLDEVTHPSHSYYDVCSHKIINRIKIQKTKIKNMFGYRDELNTYDVMLLNGFDRIWDAGQYRFSMNKSRID